MTLILAVQGLGIFGDRKISCVDGSKCEDLVKVASNDALVAGFAGDFGPVLKAIEAVQEGEDDPAMLARINVDGLVMMNGRILLIDSGKVWKRRKNSIFYATGTGYAEALAYLSGLTNKTKKVNEQAVKQTFKYVSKVRDDCSAKYDFLPG